MARTHETGPDVGQRRHQGFRLLPPARNTLQGPNVVLAPEPHYNSDEERESYRDRILELNWDILIDIDLGDGGVEETTIECCIGIIKGLRLSGDAAAIQTAANLRVTLVMHLLNVRDAARPEDEVDREPAAPPANTGAKLKRPASDMDGDVDNEDGDEEDDDDDDDDVDEVESAEQDDEGSDQDQLQPSGSKRKPKKVKTVVTSRDCPLESCNFGFTGSMAAKRCRMNDHLEKVHGILLPRAKGPARGGNVTAHIATQKAALKAWCEQNQEAWNESYFDGN